MSKGSRNVPIVISFTVGCRRTRFLIRIPQACGLRASERGIQMDHNQSNNARSAPASLRRAVRPTARRNGMRRMYLGVFFTATAIGTLAALSTLLVTAASRVADNSAPSAANASGRIILHPGEEGCANRRFDNRTGQISEAPGPCRNETQLDAKGMPIPSGTINTMNSISKSFR